MALILDGTSGASLVQPAVITQAALGPNVVGNGPCFSAYQSTAQSIPASAFTKIQFQTKEFDTNNNFDNTTNYRFTPTVAGYYQLSSAFSISTTGTNLQIAIFKNSIQFKTGTNANPSGTTSMSALIFFNGTSDYAEIYGASGTAQNASASANATYFQASMVRSASGTG
jgi:hypothetical protein